MISVLTIFITSMNYSLMSDYILNLYAKHYFYLVIYQLKIICISISKRDKLSTLINYRVIYSKHHHRHNSNHHLEVDKEWISNRYNRCNNNSNNSNNNQHGSN
jgi:hypothetical protein